MAPLRRSEHNVSWFLAELGARVVAETGIPSDRDHLGKLILRSFKDAPDFILQIDAATEETENFKSVLKRSVQCAAAFKNLGLKLGDNIVLMAPNHIHLTIPFYAALYLGITIAPLDAGLTTLELQSMFKMIEPKVIFCQKEKTPYVKEALKIEQLVASVVYFGDDDNGDCIKFSNFINNETDVDVETFVGSDFDPVETIAVLTSTSGTTGLPKCASLTQKNLAISLQTAWLCCTKFPTPTRLALVVSPLQWLTGIIHFTLGPILRYTRLQTSHTVTADYLVPVINKYKPTYMIISPPLMTSLIKPENMSKCDISCFEVIIIGGSAVSVELLQSVQNISPNIFVRGLYGLSEAGGMVFYEQHLAPVSVGRTMGHLEYRLVNPDTQEDITEPNVNGELWLRGPSVSKGYYRQPEATKESFVEDGWFRTGDILYRDEHYFFYFVERLKMMLKYKNHQISPLELEKVIQKHPGVMDVAVTGIPDRECGELPVACVIKHSGHHVTAQEIKDLVKSSLTDTKLLRGGVIFMKEFPMTATAKIHRRLLKEKVLTMTRE